MKERSIDSHTLTTYLALMSSAPKISYHYGLYRPISPRKTGGLLSLILSIPRGLMRVAPLQFN
jgi:hypothetical protein